MWLKTNFSGCHLCVLFLGLHNWTHHKTLYILGSGLTLSSSVIWEHCSQLGSDEFERCAYYIMCIFSFIFQPFPHCSCHIRHHGFGKALTSVCQLMKPSLFLLNWKKYEYISVHEIYTLSFKSWQFAQIYYFSYC